MFKLFGSGKKPVAGLIAYYDLTDWWLNELSQDERKTILEVYHPLGSSSSELIEGDISHASGSVIGLLSALSGWFNNKRYRTLAKKILKKATDLKPDALADTLDVHFLYQTIAKTYYPDRDIDPEALGNTVEACSEQIAMSLLAAQAFKTVYPTQSLPAHHGYEQLAIIREKQENYESAIQLCRAALEEGWAGDWEKRIARCEAKATTKKSTENV